jgi:hypothetical protein
METRILAGHIKQSMLDSTQVATFWNFKRTVRQFVRGKQGSLLVMPICLAASDSQKCVHIRLTPTSRLSRVGASHGVDHYGSNSEPAQT